MYSRIRAFRLVPCWRATSRARSTVGSSTARVMFIAHNTCAHYLCQPNLALLQIEPACEDGANVGGVARDGDARLVDRKGAGPLPAGRAGRAPPPRLASLVDRKG